MGGGGKPYIIGGGSGKQMIKMEEMKIKIETEGTAKVTITYPDGRWILLEETDRGE